MPRKKERRKHIHDPSTQEIFRSLSCMPKWSQILLDQSENKAYQPFLNWLIEVNYFNEREERLKIKTIADAFNSETPKVTKWLHQIYDDLIALNNDKPKLFTGNKLSVTLYCRYFDSSVCISLGLDVIPRQYERISFPFAGAKTGTDHFWVEKVEHQIYDSEVEIFIWLEGGILNRYREMAVEEAEFKGWLGFMDIWEKTSSEIDEILLHRLR